MIGPQFVMTKATSTQPAADLSTNLLRDIVPPQPIPNLTFWIGVALGVLSAAVLACLLWRRWRTRRASRPPAPPTPAHILAKRRLTDALALIADAREFCIAVSDALRWYLERRFEFRAPERTTEEFLVELRDSPTLDARQKASLAEFLNRCDLVKFARYEPAEPELRDLHGAAMRLVEETEPQLAAPGAQAPTETTALSA